MSDSPDAASEPEGESSSKPARARKAPIVRPFPRRTLEESLKVATAIKEKNGGNPWDTKQVAAALNFGAASNNFFYLTAASRDFGLTEGTRDTAEITLTALGKRAVLPRTPEERDEALNEAFFSVDLFKKVVAHYGGSALPEKEFLTNTLVTSYGLDESLVDEFIELFNANTRYLKIGVDYTGGEESPAGPEQTQTIATPKKKDGGKSPVCFVAMPFTERDDRHAVGFFDEVLEQIFTPAIVAAGFEVRTAKKQGSDVIQSTIVTELLGADLVLADLTEHNPNVLFELGMRMHADLPIALVRAKGTGAIFDVDQMLRVADYSPNLWPSTVARDIETITAHLRAAWENRSNLQTYMKILSAS